MTSTPAQLPDHMQLTAFTVHPDARWNTSIVTITVPEAWVHRLKNLYQHAHKGWSLPTRSLRELLMAVDPAILYVAWKLDEPGAIMALPGVNLRSVAIAIAAWASTEVCPDHAISDEWWDLFDSDSLAVHIDMVNLLEFNVRDNLTAAPAPAMFHLLPTAAAQHVVSHGLPLLATPRDLILGPPRLQGRSVFLFPFERLDGAGGLATTKINFHVQTVPNHPLPHIHADLSTSRAPVQPVTYVPARGDGPPAATVLLHAPDGFSGDAPASLLAAVAEHRWTRDGGKVWQWKPGLARALSRLTHLPFPPADHVFTNPAGASMNKDLQAFVLYSEGSRSEAEEDENSDDGLAEETPKAKSLRHAAKTGLTPADHMEVFEQLAPALEKVGVVPVKPARRVGKKGQRLLKGVDRTGHQYTLELRLETELTRQALLVALEQELGLKPEVLPENPHAIRYTGAIDLTVAFAEAGTLGAGIERVDKQAPSATRGLYASKLQRDLGRSDHPVATILELRGASFFSKARLIDPKPALKKAFARTNRRLQCLRPATAFKPPAKPRKDPKKTPTPYPGTDLSRGSVHRAKAAVLDALRQLGRIPTFEAPAGLPPLEQIGIDLLHDGATCIPVVVRIPPHGEPVAHLAAPDGQSLPPIPYRDLPEAISTGKGRIKKGRDQMLQVAEFLCNAIGAGPTGAHDTHDRVVFVRAAGFRDWGWDWLHDKNIRPQQLALPGQQFDDDTVTPPLLNPAQCPGLRIVRVRDRTSTNEVALGFALNHTEESPRSIGLFTFNDSVFYGINPKPDQNQTPLSITKLDRDMPRNFTFRVANPTALEIHPAFLQAGDDREAYAMLTHQLRRVHLHTDQATLFPTAVHLCRLAAEYV